MSEMGAALRMNTIDAIIFDLGGVIINISYDATIRAFSHLCGFDISTLYTQQLQDPLFDAYEMGTLTSDEFRDGVRRLLQIDCPDEAIDAAWNAMLLDIPAERIALLKAIAPQKRIFLLSNTNEIHKTRFDQLFADCYGNEFESISAMFEKAYYSHLVGDRKPNVSIFQRVIDEQGLDPRRTLFIEDTLRHIEGAQVAGLQTIHLTGGLTLSRWD
ncbi:MAG: HAD family hydrolase [Elainellaceae cyanobacterium]